MRLTWPLLKQRKKWIIYGTCATGHFWLPWQTLACASTRHADYAVGISIGMKAGRSSSEKVINKQSFVFHPARCTHYAIIYPPAPAWMEDLEDRSLHYPSS